MRLMRPTVVITFVHNSSVYWWLSRNLDGVHFIQIANAIDVPRNVTTDPVGPGNPEGLISTPVAYFLGQHDVDLYHEYGHQIDRMIAVGSVRADCYRARATPVARDFDICLISQWSFGKGPSWRLWSEIRLSMDIVASLLKRYVAERRLRLCVVLRSNDAAEIRYVKELFGPACEAFPRVDLFDSYRLIDRSDVVVSFSSSIAYEAYSWGKKVLTCNPLKLTAYRIPIAPECSADTEDYAEFRTKLDELRGLDQVRYQSRTEASQRYLVEYNPDRPSFEVIRAELHAALATCAMVDK